MIADSRFKTELTQIVLKVELLQRESIYGFQENKKFQFLKVNLFVVDIEMFDLITKNTIIDHFGSSQVQCSL